MALFAFVVSLALGALGAVGVVEPRRLLAIVRGFQSEARLFAIAVVRLVFGIALYVAAPGSRAEVAVRAVGVLAILSGLLTPFFGLARFRALLDWWAARGETFVRVWAGVALLFGAWLAWALAPFGGA